MNSSVVTTLRARPVPTSLRWRTLQSTFHRSPERLGPDHIRQYQAYLFRERKLSPGTIQGRTAALPFSLRQTLRRPYLPDDIPFPKRQRRLPTYLDRRRWRG